MKRLFKYIFITLFVISFYGAGFLVPWDLGPDGTVSIAKATHSGHDPRGIGHGGGGGTPPTVSELPIQYMVAGGIIFILISGGMVYLIRNRGKKRSSET